MVQICLFSDDEEEDQNRKCDNKFTADSKTYCGALRAIVSPTKSSLPVLQSLDSSKKCNENNKQNKKTVQSDPSFKRTNNPTSENKYPACSGDNEFRSEERDNIHGESSKQQQQPINSAEADIHIPGRRQRIPGKFLLPPQKPAGTGSTT